LPTGSASPASRASSESGEMLAFAHIPTGATANEGFDIDEVKVESLNQPSRSPRSEPTLKSAGLHLKERLRLSHDRGPPHYFPFQDTTHDPTMPKNKERYETKYRERLIVTLAAPVRVNRSPMKPNMRSPFRRLSFAITVSLSAL
jgi:hypothetical protein